MQKVYFISLFFIVSASCNKGPSMTKKTMISENNKNQESTVNHVTEDEVDSTKSNQIQHLPGIAGGHSKVKTNDSSSTNSSVRQVEAGMTYLPQGTVNNPFGSPLKTMESRLIGKVYEFPVEGVDLQAEYSNIPIPFEREWYIGSVYSEDLNISQKIFTSGFPNLQKPKSSEKLIEWFGVHFKGTLVIEEPGEYEFNLASGDGAKFYLNDRLIIDNDGVHKFKSKKSEIINLAIGEHPIDIYYFKGGKLGSEEIENLNVVIEDNVEADKQVTQAKPVKVSVVKPVKLEPAKLALPAEPVKLSTVKPVKLEPAKLSLPTTPQITTVKPVKLEPAQLGLPSSGLNFSHNSNLGLSLIGLQLKWKKPNSQNFVVVPREVFKKIDSL